MSNITLKRCPFCGGEANLHLSSDEFCWYVSCSECANKTTHFYGGKDIAIRRWNTRNDKAVIDGFLARVCGRFTESAAGSDISDVHRINALLLVYTETYGGDAWPSPHAEMLGKEAE